MTLQAVSWLRSHDKEARTIAEAGREFALTHLNRESRLCYWKMMMEEYGRLFTWVSCLRVPVSVLLDFWRLSKKHVWIFTTDICMLTKCPAGQIFKVRSVRNNIQQGLWASTKKSQKVWNHWNSTVRKRESTQTPTINPSNQPTTSPPANSEYWRAPTSHRTVNFSA